MASEIAKQCADKLYEAMSQIDGKNFPWWHDPHKFLPANVCIDPNGKETFKCLLADTIQKVLDTNRGKRL